MDEDQEMRQKFESYRRWKQRMYEEEIARNTVWIITFITVAIGLAIFFGMAWWTQ